MGDSQSKSSANDIPTKRELSNSRGGDFYVATAGALIRHLDAQMKAVHKNDTLNKEILRRAKSIVENDSKDFQDDFQLKIHLFNGVFIYHNGDRSMELNVELKGGRVVSEFSTITGDIHIETVTALVADLDTKLRKVRKSDTETREILQEARAFVIRENKDFDEDYELNVHLPSGILTYHNGDRSKEANVDRKGDKVVSEFSTITGGEIPITEYADLSHDLTTKLKKVRKTDTKTKELLLAARLFVINESRNFHGNYELKVHLPSAILIYHNGDRSNRMCVDCNGGKPGGRYLSRNLSTAIYDTGRSAVGSAWGYTFGFAQKALGY